jgi:hypothetical protein
MQIRDLLRTAAMAVAACAGLVACGWAGCGGPRGASHPPGDSDPGSAGDAATDAASDDGTLPPPSDGGPATGPLRVGTRNPRYFVDAAGKPVYLTGSHTWGSFKDRAHVDPPPPFNYAAFLDFLVAHRHNFIRLWTWEQPHSFDDDPANPLHFTPFPWLRTGPGVANDGKPRFDLDKLDPAYTSRLRARVIAARDRGIYVAVMLFDGWDLANAYNPTDGGFPFGAGNNINGVAATGPEVVAGTSAAVTARQEAYVRAVIDAVNDLDNVLYEIANETKRTPESIAWQYAMIDFVHTYEKAKPKQHPVGMTSTYTMEDQSLDTDADLYASNADWISPNTQVPDGDGRKVVLNDSDHSYGWSQLQSATPAGQRKWAWQTFCRGSAPVFMDPYLEVWAGRNSPPDSSTPDAQWNVLRDALGYTALYAGKLDLERALPSTSLCSTGYCLVEPGRQYLVYQPGSGNFKLTVAAGTYAAEWFNPATEKPVDGGTLTVADGLRTFTPPFTGDAVLWLHAQ